MQVELYMSLLTDVQVYLTNTDRLFLRDHSQKISNKICFELQCGIGILASNRFVQVFSLSDMSYGLKILCVSSCAVDFKNIMLGCIA